MTAPLRLHYAPDNASLCVRIAMEEVGCDYTTTLVDRSIKAQKSPAYLALNPNGLIPVLETPHGPLFETGAILVWLSETYAALIPQQQGRERMHAIKWMFWLSNTLHPALRMSFYPNNYSMGPPADLRNQDNLTAHFDVLEAAEDASWLDDDSASAMACYLAPMLRWSALYGDGPSWMQLDRWPRLYAFAKRMEQRPAAIRSAQAEGLGPNPFSAPQPPNPPEGSAL